MLKHCFPISVQPEVDLGLDVVHSMNMHSTFLSASAMRFLGIRRCNVLVTGCTCCGTCPCPSPCPCPRPARRDARCAVSVDCPGN